MSSVEREIIDLHRFFVGWFGGTIANTDEAYAQGFTSKCDPAFVLVSPAGTLTRLDDLAAGLRRGHGTNQQFRIQVRDVETHHDANGIVIATYQEWQRNATSYKPPDNGRLSTAAFKRDPGAPNGLRWLHVHETWLPAEAMAAGPYDF